MKEPKRLLSHGATDFERQLLRAVVSERPSALLRSRMQRGLGLVGPLAWATNVKAMVGTLNSKLVLGAATAGVVVAGGVAAYQFVPRSPSLPEAAAPAPVLQALPPAASAPTVLAPEAPPAPPSSGSSASGADVPEPAPAEAAGDGQLREEIALIDGVRAALQRGDREQARARLATYRERFPDGILEREAKVLQRRAAEMPARASGR